MQRVFCCRHMSCCHPDPLVLLLVLVLPFLLIVTILGALGLGSQLPCCLMLCLFLLWMHVQCIV